MIRLILSIALILFALRSQAQDLHAYYDVLADTVSFVKNGKVVTQPEVKRGSQVIVHILNYNNYLYDLEIEVEEKQIQLNRGTQDNSMALGDASSGSSMLGLILGGTGMGMGIPGFASISGLIDGQMGFASTTLSETQKAQEIRVKAIEEELSAHMSDLKRKEKRLSDLEDEIPTLLEAIELERFAHDEIYRIRLDPYLTPVQIKTMAMEYAAIIFKETDPEKINFAALRALENSHDKLKAHLNEYKVIKTQYKTTASKIQEGLVELETFDLPHTTLDEYIQSVKMYHNLVQSREVIYEERSNQISAVVEEVKGLSLDNLITLRTIYGALLTNTFSKTYPFDASGETMIFRITMIPLEAGIKAGVLERKLAPFKVNVVGGLKVTSSVGLGFSQFFQQPLSYYVRDSIIRSNKRDAFIPQLTSFVNFYYPRSGFVNWGGSIGVGIPITGGDGLQSLSFFIGPSVILGQTGRIILSTGLMGGRVAKPSQGYQVGDVFEGDPALFTTENHYQLGYFFSASINLSAR